MIVCGKNKEDLVECNGAFHFFLFFLFCCFFFFFAQTLKCKTVSSKFQGLTLWMYSIFETEEITF